MKTTTSFSAAMRTDIPLTYRCEHCGQMVSMTYPLRTEYAVASPGTAYDNSALKQRFAQTTDKVILDKMEKELIELDECFNKQRLYYCLDGFISAGKCPHCKKMQTWHKLVVSGEGKTGGAWLGAFAGFLFGTGVYAVVQSLFSLPDGMIAVVVMAVFTAIGVFVGRALGKHFGESKRQKFEAWLANAPQEQIPRLLVDQHSKPQFIDAGLRGMYNM